MAAITGQGKQMALFVKDTISRASGIVLNSVVELEREQCAAIQRYPVMSDVPLYFVGPFISDERASDTNSGQQDKVRVR